MAVGFADRVRKRSSAFTEGGAARLTALNVSRPESLRTPLF